jgi:3-dehydroquinate synthase
VTVHHHSGSYDVDFLPLAQALQELPPDAFVITDQNVAEHYEALVPSELPRLVLPPGETTKSLIWLERIASWLAESGASRKSTLVALGGGVIGDLVGFAAATYMRGVGYVQVPTTLLAQVDSSVGGKVAVDIPQGKNLLGAFHAPLRVTIDPATLGTLSLRQRRNGMAEVWKTGFIMDPALVEDLAASRLADEEIIRTCVAHKAAIVGQDEFETKGLRATLNFGHTIGHAIEQLTGYRTLLHGEAISIGMVGEALLGEQLGVTQPGTAKVVRERLEQAGLPVRMPALEPDSLVKVMRKDKKATGHRLAFSLLTQIGGCKLVENVDDKEVVRALQRL